MFLISLFQIRPVPNPPYRYTSNVFAILGLRSLYFLLAGVVDKFHHLKLGLSVVLVFVGIKMVIVDFYKIPVGLSLGLIAAILDYIHYCVTPSFKTP
jgi:predicted tellurium resistance membrane protein TerC